MYVTAKTEIETTMFKESGEKVVKTSVYSTGYILLSDEMLTPIVSVH